MNTSETPGPENITATQDEALRRLLEEAPEYESAETFWAAVQSNIKGGLGHERYSIWFKQTELMGLRNDCLVVGVPNVVIQQFVTQRYTAAVAQAVEELIGRPMAVSFDVAPRLFRQMRARRRAESEALAAEPAEPQASQGRAFSGATPPAGWGFDHLIVTEANRLPMAAAREVGGQENPRFHFLYVCGDFGLGKSALLRGIYALAAAPERRLGPLYVSAGDWCADYYHSIQGNSSRAFRNRYRSCGMLIMDDVQFVQGRHGSQRELVQMVKHILDKGGRVALAGRPRPHELSDVDPAFTALLRKAFPAALVRPAEQERVHIVKHLAARSGVLATDETWRLVARVHGQCFGSMQTAVSGLALLAGMNGGGRITVPMAADALAAMKPPPGKPVVGLADVKEAVLDVFQVSAEELVSRSRSRTVCRARQVAMFLSRKYAGASLAEVGRYYGGRTHSTVKHGVERVATASERDTHLASLVERLERRLADSSGQAAD